MDQYKQRQQRRNQVNRIKQRTQGGAGRNFDQEVGAFGQRNEYDDLNTDFETGGLMSDLDAGLNTEFEIGELGQNYEFPLDQQRQGRRQQAQRTQRRKSDR